MNNKSFDLQERCLKFAKEVLSFLRKSKLDSINSILAKQLIRSSTSIGANITEGQNSLNIKGLSNYYRIALKSSNETAYWLKLFKGSENLRIEQLDNLLSEAEQISKIIATIIIKLKDK